MIKRMLFGLAALVFSAASLAASVVDRSPFAQGHWWNPQRSGEGFDIFNAAGQVAVMWFTYDELGKPGEMLHATRFLDDRLYAVTFKKIDPLYIVDLVNVSDPRITGTLEMRGFADTCICCPTGCCWDSARTRCRRA